MRSLSTGYDSTESSNVCSEAAGDHVEELVRQFVADQCKVLRFFSGVGRGDRCVNNENREFCKPE